MKLSIIIPVYNEEGTVGQILDGVLAVVLPPSVEKEIIAVNDGSTDRTSAILKAYANQSCIRVITLEQNRGKSGAILEGLKLATGDVVLIQDADLEYTPDQYPILLEPILNKKADVVYGSRFLGTIKNMTFVNRWANGVSTSTVNCLYKSAITDLHTGFKVFKREILKKFELTSSGFSLDTELTCKILKAGYTIVEVPIPYKARSREEGKKITWASALKTYVTLFQCRFCK
ncbi:MAG: glycosyltransferase family 2 protein [Candidatus Omnitrophica bacterium]|nr:glycosyltransferase family 2 protein [Candidatus Omnitrophota bacterium]